MILKVAIILAHLAVGLMIAVADDVGDNYDVRVPASAEDVTRELKDEVVNSVKTIDEVFKALKRFTGEDVATSKYLQKRGELGRRFGWVDMKEILKTAGNVATALGNGRDVDASEYLQKRGELGRRFGWEDMKQILKTAGNVATALGTGRDVDASEHTRTADEVRDDAASVANAEAALNKLIDG